MEETKKVEKKKSGTKTNVLTKNLPQWLGWLIFAIGVILVVGIGTLALVLASLAA